MKLLLATLRTLLSVRLPVHPSVRLSVIPVSQCYCHRIIIKFLGVITIGKNDVHISGQGQRSKVKLIEVKTNFASIWAFPDCNSIFEFTDGYEITHTAWSGTEEVPYCFSKLSVKFPGHTGRKIDDFDPKWAFPDCNTSLNLHMAMKWCTKLDVG